MSKESFSQLALNTANITRNILSLKTTWTVSAKALPQPFVWCQICEKICYCCSSANSSWKRKLILLSVIFRFFRCPGKLAAAQVQQLVILCLVPRLRGCLRNLCCCVSRNADEEQHLYVELQDASTETIGAWKCYASVFRISSCIHTGLKSYVVRETDLPKKSFLSFQRFLVVSK